MTSADAPLEDSEQGPELQVTPYRPFPAFADFAEAPFNTRAFDAFAQLLVVAKQEADDERLESAVRTATKWAAVDTGAIEGLYSVDRGFTFSVAAESAAWDNLHLVVGEEAGHLINDALSAYDFVLDVATESRPLTEAWVRELHEVICASQRTYVVLTDAGRQEQDLPKGEYKQFPNNPFNLASQSIHSYAPVSDTGPEMQRLIAETQTEAFKAAHPVVQAAYVHYAFVCVHPFADGNGRVSRALASVFLYRSPGVPLVIFADQKPAYIDALEAADAGNFAPFIQFIAERAADVVRMVVRDLKRTPRVPLSDRLQAMQDALLGRGGLTHEEVDALSLTVVSEFHQALQKALANNPVASPLQVDNRLMQIVHTARVDGYRSAPNANAVVLDVRSPAPAQAQVQKQFTVWIAKGQSENPDFILVDASDGTIIEEVILREVTPFVSPALSYRLDISAEECLLDIVDRAVEAAEAELRRTGYRD